MTHPISPHELVKQGNTLRQLHKHAAAEKKYAEALVQDPLNVSAQWGLGAALFNQGKKKEAVKEWEKGLAQHPGYADFYHSLALYCLNRKEYKKGMSYVDEWMKYQPNHPTAHLDKAKMLFWAKSRDHKSIMHHATEARRLAPYDDRMLAFMADMLWEIKHDAKAATEEFILALKIDPGNAYIHNNFGVMLLDSGDPKRAYEEFKLALHLDPALNVSVENLGKAFIQLHPALAWTYKITRIPERLPVLNKLSPRHRRIAIFGLLVLTYIAMLRFSVSLFLLVHVSFILFMMILYFQTIVSRILLFFFRKGWVK